MIRSRPVHEFGAEFRDDVAFFGDTVIIGFHDVFNKSSNEVLG